MKEILKPTSIIYSNSITPQPQAIMLPNSIPSISGPLLSPYLAPITILLPQWALIIIFAIIPFYMWLNYWPGRNAKVIPIRASAFSPDKVPSNLDTIVIGSGSGGCSCSNILAQSGQRVLLLEQHEERTPSREPHVTYVGLLCKGVCPSTSAAFKWFRHASERSCTGWGKDRGLYAYFPNQRVWVGYWTSLHFRG